MVVGNSINVSNSGIVGFNGTAFVESSATQHAVQVGGSSTSALSSIGVGGTGTVLAGITSSDPAFTAYPQVSGLGVGVSPGSTNGITFDASNYITSYVINGSWTPIVTVSGSATGITYLTQTGFYSKIGQIVVATYTIVLTSKGSNSGETLITNLPFSCAIDNYSGSIRYDSIGLSASYFSLVIVTRGGTSSLSVLQSSTSSVLGTTPINGGNLTNSSTFFGSIVYVTS